MVLHRVKTSNAQNRERRIWRGPWAWPPVFRIDSQPMYHDLSKIQRWVIPENVAVVELRDRYAELAIRKLRVDVISAYRQIRPVQGHAEGCIQKSRRHHAGPCRKIPVVNVDMPRAFFSEAYRNV